MRAMADRCRQDLNDPPTSVGGIQERAMADWCRLDLNEPPAAAGGIREAASSKDEEGQRANYGMKV